MTALIIGIVAAAALLLVSGALLVNSRRKGRAPELEPPAEAGRRGATTTLERPKPAPAAPEVDTGEAPVEEGVDEATVTEIEEALGGVTVEEPPAEEAPPVEEAPVEEIVKPSFRDRLSKARGAVSGYLGSIRSRARIDDETWDDLEEALIRADVGVATTTDVLDGLRARVQAEGITDPEALLEALKADLTTRLEEGDRSLHFAQPGPTVWLFVGVNGVGKTTTIGKLGKAQIDEGRSVVMAAGDTFRAAAAEQLGTWAERSGAEFVRGAEGADPGAIIFDAVERAEARGMDLVMGDTAGRLHTKTNLMEELRKVRRVAEKGSGKVSEVLLVLDATTGQNGLVQAREFTDAVEVTGVVLTKLDGSAKGGITLAIHGELGIPVKLVGLGEGIGDLVPFEPAEFVDALFA